MNEKIISILALAALLTSCSSIKELEKSQPTFTDKTTKDPKSYVGCISREWYSLNNGTKEFNTSTGFELIVPGFAASADEILVIEESPSGSLITLHERSPAFSSKKYRDTAKSCL